MYANKAFEFGADNIKNLNSFYNQPELFKAWTISYGREKIILGVDSLEHQIRIGGWLKKMKIDLINTLPTTMRNLKYIKNTDISRNSLLEGAPVELYQELLAEFPNLQVLAKGVIRNITDIKTLKKLVYTV